MSQIDDLLHQLTDIRRQLLALQRLEHSGGTASLPSNVTVYSGTPTAGAVTYWTGAGTVAHWTYGTADMMLLSTNQSASGIKTFTDSIAIAGTATTGNNLSVTRNLGSASTNSPVVSMVQDNTGDDQALLYLQQDGSGNILEVYLGTAQVLLINQNGVLSAKNTSNTQVVAGRFSNNTGGALLAVRKSRGATVDTHTIVNNGDDLGVFAFQGSDGSTFANAASIAASVDGTPGASDMPGALEFRTTPDGSTTPAAHVYIKSTGLVGIDAPTPLGQLHVDQTSTTAAIPVLVLDQADTDQDFIEFIGTSGSGTVTSISTQVLGTYRGKFQITVNGSKFFVPYYD